MRVIDKIIIHCSATPERKHFTTEDINNWHIQRGFKNIGYHYVIYLDGSIHKGRPEEEIGAHCTGANTTSIGICYIGGIDALTRKPKDTRTDAQKESLVKLVNELKNKYPSAIVLGHNELSNKDCPCFDVKAEFR
jgi:N-acetylmuramoyl-L-alanine amidase